MNVRIAGRHIEMTEAIKGHIESGLDKIGEHFDRVIDVDVVLDVQKQEHSAEVNLHANGLNIHAKGTSDDLYASIDSALQKIDRQVNKHKDRISRHRPRTAREARDYDHRVIELTPPEEGNGQDVEDTYHKVVSREKIALKSLTIDEATLQLDLLEDSFLVFSNAETQQVNVIYERRDSTYGVVEPQF